MKKNRESLEKLAAQKPKEDFSYFYQCSGRLEKLTGQKLSEPPCPIMDCMELLNVPPSMIDRVLGISRQAPLLRRASAFLVASELNHQQLKKHTAAAIGAYVAQQLMKGNHDVLRAMSQALLCVQTGDIRAYRGKGTIWDRLKVVMAYYAVEKVGCKRPSQADVLAALEMMKLPMRKDRVSKIFDELGLRKVANDARRAVKAADKLPMKSD